MEFYSLSVSRTLEILKTSKNGLSNEEAKRRLNIHGYNELSRGKRTTAFQIFINQFKNPLIRLLVFASILSLVLKDFIEAIAIFGIIMLNALLGFIQEYKAEKAIEALEKLSQPVAKVLRDGNEEKIAAKELVPGDIVILEEGDIVPADIRLIEVSSLEINEATLTGESVPSKKTILPFKPGTHVANQENMAFMGTTVTYGKGLGVVTATGMKTEFGKIAHFLQTTKEVKTPLQTKFEKLTKQISIIIIALIAFIFSLGLLFNKELSFGKMVLFSLALTVSVIPNSLPVIAIVSLSLGAKRLAKKNMLVKKLNAAESLGSATIICSDKTGTITKNQMTITHLFYDNKIIEVSGSGYIPKGSFYYNGRTFDHKKIELLFRTGFLCNNAKLIVKENNYEIFGDPTEGSLVVLAKKAGLNEEEIRNNFVLLKEIPFDSERKLMSAIFNNKKDKKIEVYVKGAPDLLLRKCSYSIKNGKVKRLTNKDKKDILKTNNLFAENALRVLALAYRKLPKKRPDYYTKESVEKNLVFIGLVGMIDPPRDEVKEAVQKCKDAGIKVMIITGDHALTTKAVAKQIGLYEEGDLILSGEELEKMSDSELEERIERVKIIARALPIQKLRIVKALQKKGHVVAMTGDGVNDAPALKKADIGVAMGINGTDVAKEVSKAILVDDNFATIVNAIEEGRNIYLKIIKSAKYLLSCNSGELTTVLIAVLLKLPLPLLPLQVLFMNLLTDDFPALGLGLEPNDEEIMKSPPKNPRENPISRDILFTIVFFGLIMGFGTLLMFHHYLNLNPSKAQTVTFTTLVMFQMFAVMSSRKMYFSLKHLNPFNNKWLFGAVLLSVLLQIIIVNWHPAQIIFKTVPLNFYDWTKIVLVSSLGFIMMELSKLIFLKRFKNSNKYSCGVK
ncbi:MAG: cation-translocating P-type ATPase [Candidatus Woesearchaeota archaeon]